MHVPKNLIKAINGTDSFTSKIKVEHFDSDHTIVEDDQSENNIYNGQTQCIDVNDSEDESYGELNSS